MKASRSNQPNQLWSHYHLSYSWSLKLQYCMAMDLRPTYLLLLYHTSLKQFQKFIYKIDLEAIYTYSESILQLFGTVLLCIIKIIHMLNDDSKHKHCHNVAGIAGYLYLSHFKPTFRFLEYILMLWIIAKLIENILLINLVKKLLRLTNY